METLLIWRVTAKETPACAETQFLSINGGKRGISGWGGGVSLTRWGFLNIVSLAQNSVEVLMC